VRLFLRMISFFVKVGEDEGIGGRGGEEGVVGEE